MVTKNSIYLYVDGQRNSGYPQFSITDVGMQLVFFQMPNSFNPELNTFSLLKKID